MTHADRIAAKRARKQRERAARKEAGYVWRGLWVRPEAKFDAGRGQRTALFRLRYSKPCAKYEGCVMYEAMTKLERDSLAGYMDGLDLDAPFPGPNRPPAYIHGFRNGRDDAECAAGLRRFPSRTAAEARAAWAEIEAMLT